MSPAYSRILTVTRVSKPFRATTNLRHLHSTGILAKSDPSLSEGPPSKPKQTGSTSSTGHSNKSSEKPSDLTDKPSGNPEHIGFAEQVGSASHTADAGKSKGQAQRHEGRDEEAGAPGVLSSIKQLMGMGTDSGDVKQNRGEGKGVTGTGTFSKSDTSKSSSQPPHSRQYHTTPPRFFAEKAKDLNSEVQSHSDGSSGARSKGKDETPGTGSNANSPSGPYKQAGGKGHDGKKTKEYQSVSREPGEEYEEVAPSQGEKESKGTYGGLNKKPGVA